MLFRPRFDAVLKPFGHPGEDMRAGLRGPYQELPGWLHTVGPEESNVGNPQARIRGRPRRISAC